MYHYQSYALTRGNLAGRISCNNSLSSVDDCPVSGFRHWNATLSARRENQISDNNPHEEQHEPIVPYDEQHEPDVRTESGDYAVVDGGIIWNKRTGDGEEQVTLTNFDARIVADILEDSGVDEHRWYEIEAQLDGNTKRFRVPAERFHQLNWVAPYLGARAIVAVGHGLKDRIRDAVQRLSQDIQERRVYTHTGWVKVDGEWLYLHANGASSAYGATDSVEVNLPPELHRYALPTPTSDDDLRDAVRVSLRMLDVAPDPIIMPLYAAIWRSVIGGADFSVWLVGHTGGGKSELAALAQQHFGAQMFARNLPAAWSSTENALEDLAFHAKDAILTIDEYVPGGSRAHDDELQRKAERIGRAQGNVSGRGRLNADGTRQPVKPPRGLIVSTGETVPRGQSLLARMFVIELRSDSVDWHRLTEAQRDARSGRYAVALAGFTESLASDRDRVLTAFRRQSNKTRVKFARSTSHRRTPLVLAELTVAFRWFLKFAVNVGAISDDERLALRRRMIRALMTAAGTQVQHQTVSDPVDHFASLLGSAIVRGRAHLATDEGQAPENPGAWGWRQVTVGSGEYQRTEWRPQGDRVGWLAGNDLYLDSKSSFASAQSVGRSIGEPIPVGEIALGKRMNERGLLRPDLSAGTLKARVRIEGERKRVWHLPIDFLAEHSDQEPLDGDEVEEDRLILENQPASQSATPKSDADDISQDSVTDGATEPTFDQAVEQLRRWLDSGAISRLPTVARAIEVGRTHVHTVGLAERLPTWIESGIEQKPLMPSRIVVTRKRLIDIAVHLRPYIEAIEGNTDGDTR